MYALLAPVIPEVPRHGDRPPVAHLYAEAKRLRQPIEGRYDEAMSFAMPGRKGFSIGPEGSEIYDDTAVVATPEFASNIQAGVMPNFGAWANHIAGALIEDEEERREVTAQLQIVDRFIFDMINTSAAVAEVHESLIDLALGTGLLRIDDGIGLHPFTVRSVPVSAFSFTVGPDGQPDGAFEDRELYPSQWDVDYPGISLPPQMDNSPSADGRPRMLKGVEGWMRDWTAPRAMRWKQVVFFPDHQHHVGFEGSAQGAGCSPYVGPFRWSKSSGEPWGRGPLFNLLPSLRTVNFAMKAVLDHADIALAGIWSVEDDGVVNVDTIRLEPGALIPKAPNSAGIENIRPGQDFQYQQFFLEEHRKAIKRALYVDELGDPERSPKTATEIQTRMANLSRRIGSPFGRMIIELVFPFIARVRYILKKRRLIQIPDVDGRTIGVLPSSPLGQSRNFDDVDAFDRFVGSVASAFGKEAVPAVVDVGGSVGYLAERFNIPHKLIRSPEQAAETVSAAAGMMNGPPPGAEPGAEQLAIEQQPPA